MILKSQMILGYGYDEYGDGNKLSIDYLDPAPADRDLLIFFPFNPSSEETGVKRGTCVITSNRELGERLRTISELGFFGINAASEVSDAELAAWFGRPPIPADVPRTVAPDRSWRDVSQGATPDGHPWAILDRRSPPPNHHECRSSHQERSGISVAGEVEIALEYEEKPQAIGLSTDGGVVEIFASPSGSWTVLITYPNHPTCMVMAGQGFEDLAPLFVGQPA